MCIFYLRYLKFAFLIHFNTECTNYNIRKKYYVAYDKACDKIILVMHNTIGNKK